MPSYTVKAPNGQMYKIEGPEGASQQDVEREVMRQYPDAGKASSAKPLEGQTFDPFNQPGTGIFDRLKGGALGRAVQLAIGAKKPEGLLDYALMAGGMYPAIAAGGGAATAAGLPGAIGRIGASGVLGGTQAAVQGRSPIAGGLTDAAVSALTEGLGTAITSGAKIGPVKLGLKGLGAPAREFERAKGLPEEAAEAIRPRLYGLLSRHLDMPSMPGGTATGVTLTDAAKWVASQRREKYQAALKELTDALNAASKPGPLAKAGDAFKSRVSPSLFEPPSGSATAEAVRKVLTTNEVKAIVDTLTTASPMEGMPMGELIGASVLPSLRVPYMSHGTRLPGGGGY